MGKILGFFVAILSFSMVAAELPKPWYQTNLQQYESGTSYADEQKKVSFGLIKSKEKNASSGQVLQNISPPKEWLGRRIKLTASVKTNLTKGAAHMIMFIDHGYGNKTSDYRRINSIKTKTDWQSYAIVLDIPDQANSHMLFGINLRGEGEVFFDDFKFEEVGYEVGVTGETKERPLKNRPSNLSFENKK